MKILYITTISNTVNAFLIPHIKFLIEQGNQVDLAFNIEQKVKSEIIEMGCKIYELPLQRFPLSTGNFSAYKMLKEIIVQERYDLVHTHTPVASAIVRLVCKGLSNVKVFYTAHGFHFYNGAPLINWLVYYPVERWLSKYTDVLITINKEDYERAKSKFKSKKIEYIPGVGIDIEKFHNLTINKVLKKKEIGIPIESFVLLSVGELNKNKNHEVIIKALAEISDKNVHYVICGEGLLKKHLINISIELGVENQVHLLGFRKDIIEICKTSDLFVFPSHREGLSVALMEAMACDLPIVCSKIRGNSDLVIDGKGGYLVRPNDIEEISLKIMRLINSQDLKKDFELFNRNMIIKYSLSNVIKLLKLIYKDEIDG